MPRGPRHPPSPGGLQQWKFPSLQSLLDEEVVLLGGLAAFALDDQALSVFRAQIVEGLAQALPYAIYAWLVDSSLAFDQVCRVFQCAPFGGQAFEIVPHHGVVPGEPVTYQEH